ncbi:DUF6491 family protein [Paraglaciecola marina]|uniref:DUF6491 family protein n=1 Tax=Paraglaciecola marina TaxID=2500157 RepID=UPI00105BB3C2|nr:DUF6491 family protein [Paraglaciecola marina]
MNMLKVTFVLVGVLILTSCSSLGVDLPSHDELLRIETEQDGRACVRQRSIRGYGSLDDDVISISSSGKKRYYLATTFMNCNSLLTSFKAGFKGDFFEVCGGRNDKIITSDEACPIKSIFEFENREAAFAAYEKVEKTRDDLRADAKKEQEEKENALKISAD